MSLPFDEWFKTSVNAHENPVLRAFQVDFTTSKEIIEETYEKQTPQARAHGTYHILLVTLIHEGIFVDEADNIARALVQAAYDRGDYD